jgi:SAM-dependent methyltransferase
MGSIAWTALPLGLFVGMNSLLTNAPRYFVEGTLGARELGIFSALAYLGLAARAFYMSFLNAVLARLADHYIEGETRQFMSIIGKTSAFIGALGILSCLTTYVFGDWILLIFGTDYQGEKAVLTLLTAAMATKTMWMLFVSALYAMKRFRLILVLQAPGGLLLFALLSLMVSRFGLGRSRVVGPSRLIHGRRNFRLGRHRLTALAANNMINNARTFDLGELQWRDTHSPPGAYQKLWKQRPSDVQESIPVEVGTQELRLERGRVVKHFSKDLQIEASKHRQLMQIGAQFGFRVPELLDLDPDGATLSYEFVENLTSCRQLFLRYALRGADLAHDANVEAIFGQIGRMLAVIHRQLDVQPKVDWNPPPVFEQIVQAFAGISTRQLLADTPCAVLHGDFGFSNVCTTPQEPQRLITIDPSPNSYSSFSCNEYASIYLDLSKFSLCLRGLIPRKYYLRLRRSRAAKLRELYLQGYSRESGFNIERKILDVVERAQLTCKIRHEMRTLAREVGCPEFYCSESEMEVLSESSPMQNDTPYAESYVKSHAAEGYGARYKSTFEGGYYGIEWRNIERPLLSNLLANMSGIETWSCLDFACGTGRITDLLAEHVRHVTGVDVSAAMLEMAPRRENVQLLQRNIIDQPMDERFSLLTAFRFFVNSEPELREAAMAALAKHALPGARLIANVHVNSWSPMGMLYRTRNAVLGRTMNRTLSRAEFIALARRHGFEAEQTHWYGFTPRLGPLTFPGMQGAMKAVEAVGRCVPLIKPCLAQSLVIVFRKSER